MISCLEWIPRNVADPNPKRYELSKAERELLAQDNEAQEEGEGQQNEEGHDDTDDDHDDDDDDVDVDDGHGNSDNIQANEQNENGPKSLSASEVIAMNQIDPSTLPKDLRMDEYSDDEDVNDGGDPTSKNTHGNDADIGDILIGRDGDSDASGMLLGTNEDEKVEEGGEREVNMREESDDDDDEDYDDLGDIPDTREYLPTDIKGLEAMNFGGYNGIADFEEGENDDDDSDVEDTNLKPDDALVIVAKTEEVCKLIIYFASESFEFAFLRSDESKY